MANIFRKALNIINPFDANTIATSRQAPGGFLNPPQRAAAPTQAQPAWAKNGFLNEQDYNEATQYHMNSTDYYNAVKAAESQAQNQSKTSNNVSTTRTQTGTQPAIDQTQQSYRPQSLGVFMGKEYFDPAQLYQDQLAYLDSTNAQSLGQLNTNKTKQLDAYGRQKADLGNRLTDILKSYQDQQTQGLGQIGNYYSNLGDIYQSSQGTREGELKNQITDLSGKAQAQTNTGMSDIDRAINDYLDQFNQQKQNLATGYQTARDQIGTGLVSDLGQRLGIRDIAAQNIQTNLQPEAITANNALIAPLQALQSKQFNNPFNTLNNGKIDTNPILQYLAGLS
jgi:hypothetical protein